MRVNECPYIVVPKHSEHSQALTMAMLTSAALDISIYCMLDMLAMLLAYITCESPYVVLGPVAGVLCRARP